jgi:hypothetical protein
MRRSADLAAADFARRHVRRQPRPPRSASWRELAWNVSRAPDDLAMIGLGVVLIGLVVYGALTQESPSGTYVVLGAVTFVFALACVLAPAAFAYRVWRAVRDGVVVTATVIHAASAEDDVEGRLLVPHAKGSFTFEFAEVAEVATGIGRGSSVDVLVDPRQPRVLFLIGATPVGAAAAAEITS